jgi:hypothetical protein
VSITPLNGLSAVLAGICSISYLYFGLYILSPALKERRIRPLLYLCVFSSIWSICYIVYYLNENVYVKDIWQRFTFAGMLTLVYLLWFLVKYLGLIKNKKAEVILSIVIWLPPLVSVYKSLSENAIARDFPFGFWFLYMEIQSTLYNLAGIACVLIFNQRTKTNKSRRQAYILSASAIVLMTLSWLADYFLGFQHGQNLIPFWLLL